MRAGLVVDGGVPRILVTGFGPFPGAPVNPTERLIEAFWNDPTLLAPYGSVRTEILDVDYETLPERLQVAGADFAPDIAVHFGLSAEAQGFTLERLARNGIAPSKPDNAGRRPEATAIVAGASDIATRLPLEAIHAALTEKGLPVSWSDDAGGYLCNYLMYQSCGGLVPGFAPAMAGFIHVPPLATGRDGPDNAMVFDDLLAGALVIVKTCAAEWRKPRALEPSET